MSHIIDVKIGPTTIVFINFVCITKTFSRSDVLPQYIIPYFIN
jgi:hypothetical protein